MNGKGSKRRPQQISDQQMADNWERVFGKARKDPQGNARSTMRHQDRTKYSRKQKHRGQSHE